MVLRVQECFNNIRGGRVFLLLAIFFFLPLLCFFFALILLMFFFSLMANFSCIFLAFFFAPRSGEPYLKVMVQDSKWRLSQPYPISIIGEGQVYKNGGGVNLMKT